jgi:hypothetical protein
LAEVDIAGKIGGGIVIQCELSFLRIKLTPDFNSLYANKL